MKSKKTILLVDDDADLNDSLGLRCRSIGLNVKTSHNALTAVKLMDETLPHLVCLDVNMPTGNGLAICEAMASDPVTAKIPVIIVTACCSSETVAKCGDLSAHYLCKSGDLWSRLEPLVRELLDLGASREMNALSTSSDRHSRTVIEQYDPVLDSIFSALGVDEHYFDPDTEGVARVPEPNALAPGIGKSLPGSRESEASRRSDSADTSAAPWILHVDDDRELSDILKLRLEAYGVSVVQAYDGFDGVRHAFTSPADAILLDYQMPRGNGEYVLKRLKQCAATMHIPVIVLTGRRDQVLEQRMLSLGAARFLYKPVRFDLLLDELRQFVPLQEPRGAACLTA